MLAIPGPSAPDGIDKTIEDRADRWIWAALPLSVGAAMVLFSLWVPYPWHTKFLAIAVFVLLPLVWCHFAYILPVHKYNKLVAGGYIIEISDPAIKEHHAQYKRALEQRLAGAREAELERHVDQLRAMALAGRDADRKQALMHAEDIHVFALRLTD